MKIGRLVAATDVFPLKPVYEAIYRLGALVLRAAVRPLPGLLGLYLTGSFVRGTHVHGRSDVDFFVVMDQDRYDPGALKSALERCVAVFPFLGPVEERLRQVVLVDERREVDNPYLLYRHRAGQLAALHEADGFVLNGPAPNAALWVAEACLQVRLAIEGVRKGTDDLYFWKTRLEVLKEVLKLSGGKWEEPRLGLDFPNQALIGVFDGRERCLQAMVELLRALDEQIGPVGLRPPNLPAWKETTLLWECTHESLRTPGPWSMRIAGFQLTVADPAWEAYRREGSLHSWLPLSCAGFAEPILVISRLERPGGLLFEWTVRQARRTLAWLPRALEDRRLLESDWGLLQLIQCIAACQALPRNFFRNRLDLLGWLASLHPAHEAFMAEMIFYVRALEDGQGMAASRALSSNFFGYLIAFAKALLGKGKYPEPASLKKRLTVSLCVVTRDRVKWLAELLVTVSAQSRLPDEVVVVDNSRTGTARAVCEEFGARWFHHPEGKLGAVRNRALREATGEVLAFTDDDCLLDPGWVAHVERSFLRDERIGAVGGKVRHYSERESAVDHFHRAYLG